MRTNYSTSHYPPTTLTPRRSAKKCRPLSRENAMQFTPSYFFLISTPFATDTWRQISEANIVTNNALAPRFTSNRINGEPVKTQLTRERIWRRLSSTHTVIAADPISVRTPLQQLEIDCQIVPLLPPPPPHPCSALTRDGSSH